MVRSRSSIPELSGTIDPARIRALPLSPTDGFLLSRIDGLTSIDELASEMGLGVEGVVASVTKLQALGLVTPPAAEWGGSVKPVLSAPPSATTTSAPAPSSRVAPRIARKATRSSAAPRPSKAPAPRRSELGELDSEEREEIDELFAKLGDIDHYALLGVDPAADKKAIKRAYFELTPRFHPDHFFRKRLGRLKPKVEAIFVRMTEAHDTLTRDQRRAEYDAYLRSTGRWSSVVAPKDEVTISRVADPPSQQGELDVAIPSAPPVAHVDEPRAQSEGPISSRFGSSETPTSTTFASDEPPTSKSPRELLAQRLAGSSSAPASRIRSLSPAREAGPAPSPTTAMEALKRRYERTAAAARASQACKYKESGLEARARGDAVAAANALRAALSFDPDDAELQASYEGAQQAADKMLADRYAKQAQEEENLGKWSEAAQSWQRVIRGRKSDPKAHLRAVRCLLNAGGDLHVARSLAQSGVDLAPKDVHARLALAEVYAAAGLARNAKRELDAAEALAPGDPAVVGAKKRLGASRVSR